VQIILFIILLLTNFKFLSQKSGKWIQRFFESVCYMKAIG